MGDAQPLLPVAETRVDGYGSARSVSSSEEVPADEDHACVLQKEYFTSSGRCLCGLRHRAVCLLVGGVLAVVTATLLFVIVRYAMVPVILKRKLAKVGCGVDCTASPVGPSPHPAPPRHDACCRHTWSF
jgi:hypothetical protein